MTLTEGIIYILSLPFVYMIAKAIHKKQMGAWLRKFWSEKKRGKAVSTWYSTTPASRAALSKYFEVHHPWYWHY